MDDKPHKQDQGQRTAGQQQQGQPPPVETDQTDDTNGQTDNSGQSENTGGDDVQRRFPLRRDRLLAWFQRWNVFLALIIPSVLSVLVIAIIIAQAIISSFQWKSMENSRIQAEETRKIENRPYLGVAFVQMKQPISDAKGIAVAAQIVNTGRTPAKDVVAKIYAKFSNDIPDKLGKITSPGLTDHAVLMPNGQMLIGTGGPLPSQEQIQQELGPNAQLYVWGTIDYVDMFNERQWVTFCFVNPDIHTTAFWSCARGNDFGLGVRPGESSGRFP